MDFSRHSGVRQGLLPAARSLHGGDVMAEQKKVVDLFPDLEYRFFPLIQKETSLEGIQGPVYQPSGKLLELDEAKTVQMSQPTEVFHDGDAKTYDMSSSEFSFEGSGEIKLWDQIEKEKKVLGYVPCPACSAKIAVTSEKRPLEIQCQECGKKGKLQ